MCVNSVHGVNKTHAMLHAFSCVCVFDKNLCVYVSSGADTCTHSISLLLAFLDSSRMTNSKGEAWAVESENSRIMPLDFNSDSDLNVM